MIDFKCPHCGDWMEADDDTAGETVPCDYCGESTEVPPDVPDELFTAEREEVIEIREETFADLGDEQIDCICYRCYQKYRLPYWKKGQSFKCKRCGQKVWVQRELPAELAAAGKVRGEAAFEVHKKEEADVVGGTRDNKVIFACPRCEQRHAAYKTRAGEVIECRDCGAEMVIPDVAHDLALERVPKALPAERPFTIGAAPFTVHFANPHSYFAFLSISIIASLLAAAGLNVLWQRTLFLRIGAGYIILAAFITQTISHIAAGQRVIADFGSIDFKIMVMNLIRFFFLMWVVAAPVVYTLYYIGDAGLLASSIALAAAGTASVLLFMFGTIMIVLGGELASVWNFRLAYRVLTPFKVELVKALGFAYLLALLGIAFFAAAGHILPALYYAWDYDYILGLLVLQFALDLGAVYFFIAMCAVLGEFLHYVSEQRVHRVSPDLFPEN